MRATTPFRFPRFFPWLALLACLCLPGHLLAQPFGAYEVWSGTGSASTGNGYFEVSDSPALNPTSAITIELWVNLSSVSGVCRSLVGKDYNTAYWVGVCGDQLRFYSRGFSSQTNAGTVPLGQWTHIAVTSDGTTQKHYINGELIGTGFPVAGPPSASTSPLRLGSDGTLWPYSPTGAMTEVRLWNVARTQDQIRSTINVQLTSPQPGLVAVWGLNTGGSDALGAHNGTLHGTVVPAVGPAIISCGSSTATSLCLDGHFFVTVSFRVGAPGTATGTGNVIPTPNPNSGIFWFFDVSNWELMVKAINGCGLNSRVWLFSAATTNVFYRLDVTDVRSAVTKTYFNYPGPPAPAVTDTSAFSDCS